MSSTRRPTRANSLNDYKTSSSKQPTKVLKPLPDPSSIKYVFLMIGMHLCKKILFFSTYVRILAYLTCLFALSSVADTLPVPKMYFSNTANFLNQYFVKLGWFWTLALSIPFVYMTTYCYCCGKKPLIYKHLVRLAIATFFWFFWVNLFIYIEGLYGHCTDKRDLRTRYECISKGFRWKGFDLSGHAFILIYSNLLLIEEARPILGWEDMQNLIRDERHARTNSLTNFGPLRNLNTDDFNTLASSYEKFLPYVRVSFIILTVFSLIWDFMLLTTVLYFHSMPEKLLSGIIAIFTWYFTYELWFKFSNVPPSAPGDGLFVYYTSEEKQPMNRRASLSRKNSLPSLAATLASRNSDR